MEIKDIDKFPKVYLRSDDTHLRRRECKACYNEMKRSKYVGRHGSGGVRDENGATGIYDTLLRSPEERYRLALLMRLYDAEYGKDE